MRAGALTDFDVVEVLGSGSFSTVFKIRSKGVDAGVYVLKETRNLSQSEQTQAHVAREVEMLLLSRGCPSIVQYFASFVERDNHYTVMEYVGGGDLYKLVERCIGAKAYLDEPTIWRYLYELSHAVAFLHNNGIIHRDIKCQNIMLTDTGHIKLIDLGLACALAPGETLVDRCGTPIYMAVEMIKKQPYGHNADVWSLGCVLYILAQHRAPFVGSNLLELCKSIVDDHPPPLSTRYSPALAQLIGRMLCKNRDLRPSVMDVLAHPYFVNYHHLQRPLLPAQPPQQQQHTAAPSSSYHSYPFDHHHRQPIFHNHHHDQQQQQQLLAHAALLVNLASNNTMTTASSCPPQPLTSLGGTTTVMLPPPPLLPVQVYDHPTLSRQQQQVRTVEPIDTYSSPHASPVYPQPMAQGREASNYYAVARAGSSSSSGGGISNNDMSVMIDTSSTSVKSGTARRVASAVPSTLMNTRRPPQQQQQVVQPPPPPPTAMTPMVTRQQSARLLQMQRQQQQQAVPARGCVTGAGELLEEGSDDEDDEEDEMMEREEAFGSRGRGGGRGEQEEAGEEEGHHMSSHKRSRRGSSTSVAMVAGLGKPSPMMGGAPGSRVGAGSGVVEVGGAMAGGRRR